MYQVILSQMIRVWECKREHLSVFKTHINLLKFVRAMMGGAGTVQGLRAGAQDILKDYVTKVVLILQGF